MSDIIEIVNESGAEHILRNKEPLIAATSFDGFANLCDEKEIPIVGMEGFAHEGDMLRSLNFVADFSDASEVNGSEARKVLIEWRKEFDGLKYSGELYIEVVL